MKIFSDQRPIYSQDPFVVPFELGYLLIESVAERRIVIRTVTSLEDFQTTDCRMVWHDHRESQVWAPELHNLDGRWYIYYAASNGHNINHRTYVLEADHPLGPYRQLGKVCDPDNDFWAIDATILEHDAQRYLIWSGWPSEHAAFPQHLYGAALLAPNRIGPRFRLSSPDFNWEKSIAPLLEGPQVLTNETGKLFLTYSCDASWTQEYKVGLLEHNGGPILDPESWHKHPEPLLLEGGHGVFVGTFYVFHRKLSHTPGWNDRVIVSKTFIWENGLPKILDF